MSIKFDDKKPGTKSEEKTSVKENKSAKDTGKDTKTTKK